MERCDGWGLKGGGECKTGIGVGNGSVDFGLIVIQKGS